MCVLSKCGRSEFLYLLSMFHVLLIPFFLEFFVGLDALISHL